MVGQEDLLTEPIELSILQPCGIGYLSREGSCIFQGRKGVQHIVIYEYPAQGDQKATLLQALQRVADHAACHEQTSTLSFWVLEYMADQKSHGIVLFARFADQAAYQAHQLSAAVGKLR